MDKEAHRIGDAAEEHNLNEKEGSTMMRTSRNTLSGATVVAAFALSLLAVPLVGCGSQATQGDGSSSSTEQAQAADMDVSSWKTLGDALAYDTGENSSAGWNEEHYVTVFSNGGQFVRVVAKMDPETYEAMLDLDMSSDDYKEKFLELMGGLPLESAEDLSAQQIPQAELDAYVGKTGQDLVDDGFVFDSYWMYGGGDSGATMVKGPMAYNVTFDASVSEEQIEDGGASIMGATIKEIYCSGVSMDATDPSAV